MKYRSYETKSLSNSELAVLQTVFSGREMSGYQVSSRIGEQTVQQQAIYGTTSVYNAIRKLAAAGLIAGRIDAHKTGKGPLPKKYRITDQGREMLEAQIFDGLIEGSARDGRFDLALAGFSILSKETALQALRKRRQRIEETLDRLKEQYISDGGDDLPFHITELFRHGMLHLQIDLRFVEELIDKVKRKR
jgi:DNA-binding PadR family transcriptional regulator